MQKTYGDPQNELYPDQNMVPNALANTARLTARLGAQLYGAKLTARMTYLTAAGVESRSLEI